jgi:hypothetical protein
MAAVLLGGLQSLTEKMEGSEKEGKISATRIGK